MAKADSMASGVAYCLVKLVGFLIFGCQGHLECLDMFG